MSDTPIMVNEQLENALECIADLERENKALREALTRTRGQWIHSVNAELCLAALEGGYDTTI